MEIEEHIKQRFNIKILIKLEKYFQEIHKMLRAVHGENTQKKTSLAMQIKRFSEGREDCKARTTSSCCLFSLTFIRIVLCNQICVMVLDGYCITTMHRHIQQ